jgi:predicted DNA-binding transcriptional regulator YafY
MAGFPVYAEHGSDGGFRLVDSYRTGLTGLTRDELSALLVFSVPEPLAQLEVGQKLKNALLKLYASANSAQQNIYLDWSAPQHEHRSVPHLAELYRAIQGGQQILIRYSLWNRVTIEKSVKPYGLVAQGGVWYIVYAGNGRIQHQRVADLDEVVIQPKPFVRPPDFDLEAYWKTYHAQLQAASTSFKTVLRVSPRLLRWLGRMLDQTLPPVSATNADERIELELCFESFEAARRQILALGGVVEVIEPEALRLSLKDVAVQILNVYR